MQAGEVGQDGDELVAPDAGHAVGGPDRVEEPAGDEREQPVAGVVAEVVVDGLEPVEVDEEHRQERRVASGAGQRGFQAVEEQHTVRETGERIVQRAVAEVGLLHLQRGDVARDAVEGHRLAACVAQRHDAVLGPDHRPSRRIMRSSTVSHPIGAAVGELAHARTVVGMQGLRHQPGILVELLGCVAEDLLHRGVHVLEAGCAPDPDAVDDVGGVLGQQPEAGFRRPQGILRVALRGDVDEGGDDAGDGVAVGDREPVPNRPRSTTTGSPALRTPSTTLLHRSPVRRVRIAGRSASASGMAGFVDDVEVGGEQPLLLDRPGRHRPRIVRACWLAACTRPSGAIDHDADAERLEQPVVRQSRVLDVTAHRCSTHAHRRRRPLVRDDEVAEPRPVEHREPRPDAGAALGVHLHEHLALAVQRGDDVAAVVGHEELDDRRHGPQARRHRVEQTVGDPAPVAAETDRLPPGARTRSSLIASGVGDVGLVDHEQLGHRVGTDLAQHGAHGVDLGRARRATAAVDDVQEEIGVDHLVERGAERFHQLVREALHEADGVGHEHGLAAGQAQAPGGGVEGGEQAVLDQHAGVGDPVEQRGLARVRVADEREGRDRAAATRLALGGAVLGQAVEVAFELRDPREDAAAIDLELGLAGPLGTDEIPRPPPAPCWLSCVPRPRSRGRR